MGPRAREVCSLIILPRLLAEPAENSDFYLAGDYFLGGLFTLHANVKGIVHLNLLQVPQCKELLESEMCTGQNEKASRAREAGQVGGQAGEERSGRGGSKCRGRQEPGPRAAQPPGLHPDQPLRVVYPWQLLQEIWKVNFTLLGHQIFFAQRGDLLMRLEIIQAIRDVSWHTANNTIPVSMCSKDCQPGQRKKPVGIRPCCFECLDCLPGAFLNQTACDGPHVRRAARVFHVPRPPDPLHPLLHRLYLPCHRVLFPDRPRLQHGQAPPACLWLLGPLPRALCLRGVLHGAQGGHRGGQCAGHDRRARRPPRP
ncbi:g-protein coupled receptor [Lynx pardinus]|uniref:G-protein coupled receptor n=1 Tax=Lynx pardinus TaxID=191816 RepID=A0A485N5M3_LYNPA|nr:g-protein coupled receptor [Lynx pardinus]